MRSPIFVLTLLLLAGCAGPGPQQPAGAAPTAAAPAVSGTSVEPGRPADPMLGVTRRVYDLNRNMQLH